MKRELSSFWNEVKNRRFTTLPSNVTRYFVRRYPRLKHLIRRRRINLRIETLVRKYKNQKADLNNFSIVYILNKADPKLLTRSIFALKKNVTNPHVVIVDLSNNDEEVASIIQNYFPKSTKITVDQNERLSEILKQINLVHDLRDYVIFANEFVKLNALANNLDSSKLNALQNYCFDIIFEYKHLKDYYINNSKLAFYENLNLFRVFFPLIQKSKLENLDLVEYFKNEFTILPAIFSVQDIDEEFKEKNLFYKFFERKYECIPLEKNNDRTNYAFEFDKKVSIIIDSNNLEATSNFINSLEKNSYDNYEVIILSPNKDINPSLFNVNEVKVVNYDFKYSFSKINNLAIRHSTGDVLAFVNENLEVLSKNWLEVLGSFAVQKDVGAVAPKLVDNKSLIRHAGIRISKNFVAINNLLSYEKDNDLTREINLIDNPDAVTGSCLFIEKSKFMEIGGFDEEFNIKLQDVDLCKSLDERDYQTLFIPYIKLQIGESAPRLSSLKLEERDYKRLLMKWTGSF